MQPVQDLTIEDRVSRTQYQFTVESVDASELSDAGCTGSSTDLRHVPQMVDVASDLQDGGLQAYVEFDRTTASRLGITPAAIDNALYNAFGQRLVSTIFTQSNQYRVVLEVKPEFQRGLAALERHLRDLDRSRPAVAAGAAVVASRRWSRTPRRCRSTTSASFRRRPISFNLAPGASLGDAVKAIEATQARTWRCPAACRSISRAQRWHFARRSTTSCG